MNSRTGPASSRGMILLTVLWILLVISFVSFALAAAVRVELAATGNSFDSERAVFMAKGAAETVLYKIQNPDTFPQSPLRQEQGEYIFQFDSGQVRVKSESEGARIDLNGADEKVMASIFDSLGINEGSKNELVDSILDWRDSDDVPRAHGAEVNDYGQVFLSRGRLPYNGPFNTMQELLLVKHMTPEVYFGRVEFDPGTNQHRKILGLRDLATVGSGRSTVDANTASIDVLAILPGMSRDLASSIVTARNQKLFADGNDLVSRVPALKDNGRLQYVTIDPGYITLLVSTATLQPSGTSRTVRLRLITERQKKVITFDPVVYKEILVVKFGSWEY